MDDKTGITSYPKPNPRRGPMRLISKILSVSLITLIQSINVHAHWEQTNGPCGAMVRSLASNGNVIFAGTYEAGAYVSTNNGSNWRGIKKGMVVKDVYSLAVKDSTVFAGTSKGTFRSIDNGVTWEKVKDVGAWGFAVNGDMIVAASGAIGAYLSLDNGKTWQNINSNYCYSAIFFGKNLMLSTNASGIILSSDTGKNWAPVGGGVPYCFLARDSILFAGSNYKSTDSGNTWTFTNNGLPSAVIYSLAQNKTTLFAAVGGQGSVYRSFDNGESWAVCDSGLPKNVCVYSLTVSGENVFAGTNEGGVFLSINNGGSWRPVNDGIVKTSTYCFSGYGNKLFAGTHCGVFLSTDNGMNWSVNYSTMKEANALSLLAQANGVFAGTRTRGILFSADNGATWSSVNITLPSSYGIRAFAVKDTNLFAGDNNEGVFISTDKGKNWLPVNNGLWTRITTLSVKGSSLFAGTTDWGVYHSTDDGANWELVDIFLPNFNYVANMAANDSAVFIGCLYRGVARSLDDGLSWEKVNPPALDTDMTALTAFGNTVLACAEGSGVWCSENNGSDWRALNDGLPDSSNVISIQVFGDYLFAGIQNYGVWRLPISEVPVKKQVTKKKLIDLKISNTAISKQGVVIEFTLSHEEMVEICIYDVSGRRVATVINRNLKAQRYHFTWETGRIAGGFYLLKVRIGNDVQFRKFPIIR